MHKSALINASLFFNAYVNADDKRTVVDIGAQNVNGSIKDVTPKNLNYIGVDFVEAKGVDVILTDPYSLPFDNESIDIIVCSSCFEHSEMFWVLFLEMMRILKPDGLLYLNVPSNGLFHRYPVDCWRFYPDSGEALVNWGRRNNLKPLLLESYTSEKIDGVWNDFVAVFLKNESNVSKFPIRILDKLSHYSNGRVNGLTEFKNYQDMPQDQKSLFTGIYCKYWLMKLNGGFKGELKRFIKLIQFK